MAIRKIVLEGDPILTKISKPVTLFDEKLSLFLDDMIETNKRADGVGLAAPQVGILRRIMIINVRDSDGIIELVNPVITETLGEQINDEGCLSIPNLYAKTLRPKFVKIKGKNRFGEDVEYSGKDLKARAFCHELDHLDGILFRQRLV